MHRIIKGLVIAIICVISVNLLLTPLSAGASVLTEGEPTGSPIWVDEPEDPYWDDTVWGDDGTSGSSDEQKTDDSTSGSSDEQETDNSTSDQSKEEKENPNEGEPENEAPISKIPEPTQEVFPTFPAKKKTIEDVIQLQEDEPLLGTTVKILLADLTTGELLCANQAEETISPSELSEWMLLLFALRNAEPENEVLITEEMLKQAKTGKLPVLFGFSAGDKISMRDLMLVFMMTRADDARTAMISELVGTENRAVGKMNLLASILQLHSTGYIATNGTYQAKQYTTVYDLYVIFRELLTHDLFRNAIEEGKADITYQQSNGTVKKKNCTSSEMRYSHLYGVPQTPEGISMLSRMSGGVNASGLAQVTLVTGTNGHKYLSVLAGIPFEKDISLESKRLLSAIKGVEYTDKRQELPLGDDKERYQYLLGTGVKYYTVDDKAPGYSNVLYANEYMMEFSVPVWILNNDGTKSASSKRLTMNRKLVTSVRKIFQEIYELPMQFPIKVLLGYGYRQSGGSGLSQSTLMSMHSYGAAIDINPGDYDNDYYLGAGNDLRDKSNPYYIPDEVITIFEKNGWFWGGYFNICVDSMHFQYLGLDYLSYQGKSPFRDLSVSGMVKSGVDVKNLQERLHELGYRVNQNGIYTQQTRMAVLKFQTREEIPVTGEVDYLTWETIINKTHYMPYVV